MPHFGLVEVRVLVTYNIIAIGEYQYFKVVYAVLKSQVYIKATGEKSAEMVTDQGAIYVTSNRGYNWKAAVQETVSATLNRYAYAERPILLS